MKSFSKRVASFAMAAAMVCSLAVVSPVDAEAAAKPAFEKTRSAITAGTNYTYAVKNVTDKQYIKVYATTGIAVKYNNAKVTKGKTEIKGGKTIKVKINANNKVANYKGKVTVKVFNKKTNKKVKDLSDSFTVKCTKLAVTDVEPATLAGSHKYIIVKFNKALSSLDPSEITIREKDTQRLVTVEKIVLAGDKKSATLTLLGDRNTSGESFIKANVDYVLTVTKSNATAEMPFKFDGVAANASVTSVNVEKSTFGAILWEDGAYYQEFTIPTTIAVDYQDLVGRTVTFWYNRNNEITKLVPASNETPVYGAFNVVSTNNGNSSELEFVSKVDSKEKYKNAVTGAGSITPSYSVGGGKTAVSGDNFDYVKIVRNPNGTIKTYQAFPMDGKILVDSVSGTILRQSKTTSVNLDKYTIVKDGKTITVDQIQKGDVVIYDTTYKFAEVYNNTVSGVIESVSSTKVTIGGKAYEYSNNTSANIFIKDDLDKNLDEETLAKYKASGESATLYFDRAGKLIYAKGTEAAIATNTTEYVLSKDAGNYGSANKHYLSLTGSNGTDKLTDMALDNLKFVYYNSSFVKVCDEDFKGTIEANVSANAVSFNGTWGTSTDVSDKIEAVSSDNATIHTICTVGDIDALSVVSVTKDSKTNDVKTIKVEQVPTTTLSGNEVFKGGLGKIPVGAGTYYKISSSTPVYEVAKDNVVTKTEYSAFTKATDKTKASLVKVYLNNVARSADSVVRVVIDNRNGDAYGLASDKDVTGVVTAYDTSTIDGTHLVTLSVMGVDGTTTTFTSFEQNSDKANVSQIALGKIVKVNYAVNNDKNVATAVTISADIDNHTACSGNDIKNNEVKINANVYKLTEDAKIFVVSNDNKSVKNISYAELMTMTYGKDGIGMYVNKYSQGYVNFVVIREDLRASVY